MPSAQEQSIKSVLITNLFMFQAIFRNLYSGLETLVDEEKMTLTVKKIPSSVLSNIKLPTSNPTSPVPAIHMKSFGVHLDNKENSINFPGLREIAQHYADMQEAHAILAGEPNFFPFGNTIPTKRNNCDGDGSEVMRGMDLIIDSHTSLMPGLDKTSGKPKHYSLVLGHNYWLVDHMH